MKLLNSAAACVAIFASSAMASNGLRGEPAEANLEPVDVVTQSVESGHRDLQLLPILCPIVSGLLPGDVTCQCAIALGFDFTCVYQKPICIGGIAGFCSAPTISGKLDILTLDVGFAYCASNATNGGVSVPGICIDIGGVLNQDSLGEGTNSADLQTCIATIDGKACSSCEICDAGTGYTFNCAAIDARMVQSKCTPLHILSSLRSDQGDIQFMPHLDGV